MKTTRIFLLILITMIGCNIPVTAQNVASASSHKIVVVADTSKRTSQQAELVGEYRKNGKTYPLYRGKRGGYFYLTGEKKDGKAVKKYLTKKEKEANNLK